MTSSPVFLSLISAVAVSLIAWIGIFAILFKENLIQRITFFLISLATGALFGDAILHLLPDIYEKSSGSGRIWSSLWVLAGIFISFVFEKFLRWKQDHGLDGRGLHEQGHAHPHEAIKPVGRIILFSDGLHNCVDGLLIGASYLSSLELGLATTLAVILHELPHELGDFAVLLDAGYSIFRALLFNFLTACLAILGVVAALVLHARVQGFVSVALSLTAGSFLYIAGSNLTPELQKESAPLKSVLQFVAMLLGVGLMALLLKLG